MTVDSSVGFFFLLLGKKVKFPRHSRILCVCACMDGMQVCVLPKRLVPNNELAEAVTFAQAQVCFVCVYVLFSRWLNCFSLPQQRAYIEGLESAVKYKEYFKTSSYLPVSFMPAGFEMSSIQSRAHAC